MDYNLITRCLILGSVLAWIVWDIILAAKGQQTESMMLRFYAKEHVWLAHFMGTIIGHWLFITRSPIQTGWMWIIPIWLALGVWDWYYNSHGGLPNQWCRWPGLWALVGIVSGMLLWGQRDGDAPF